MDGISTESDALQTGKTLAVTKEPEVQQTDTAVKNETDPKETAAQESDYVKQLRAGFEKEKAEAVKAAVDEAVKKASMKPEEVKEYEDQKKAADLERKEKELTLREMKNDTRDILHEKDIPVQFAEFLIGESMEKTRENIDAFKKEFDLAVQGQVEQRLKGTTPKTSSGVVGTEAGGMAAEIDRYL